MDNVHLYEFFCKVGHFFTFEILPFGENSGYKTGLHAITIQHSSQHSRI